MAQQDKTDWYWNGVLAGAVNNLYYDFINVDLVRVPYVTTHRNSSFFLQTRRNYYSADDWATAANTYKDWDVVDVKYIWEDKCNKNTWTVYVMLVNKDKSKMRIHFAQILDWCVWQFNRNQWPARNIHWCGAYEMFTTNYVKWPSISPSDIKEETWIWTPEKSWGIQINKYSWWTTHWLFSDTNVENGSEKFVNYKVWQYILVYESQNRDWDWHAWQVRMITWMEWNRLTVDAPWLWFKVLSGADWDKEVKWGWLSYKIFDDWGEVLWFTEWNQIYIYTDKDDTDVVPIYDQRGVTNTKIISVTEAVDKIFVLTDNGYIHYSNYVWKNKFFIQDDMYAWVDKTSLTTFRDIIIAFGNKHIAVGVPDENNLYAAMYNQSTTVWLRSRYSYWEYDWDLVFVSNDKRLLALGIAGNTGRYMLDCKDVWDTINSKLSALVPTDEIFIWTDENDLKVFLQTKSSPYYSYTNQLDYRAHLTDWHNNYNKEKVEYENTLTRIIKFDKQFKVWTEDIVQWILLQWVESGVYFWENWLYLRAIWSTWKDYKWGEDLTAYEYKTYISAYLIENETDWVWGTNSWLASRPKLYNIAKLNRLITTLWPWIYSHDSKIKITSYVKWLWSVYEFSIDGWNNDWLWLMTTKYLWEYLSPEDEEKLKCMASVIQDGQKAYQPKCTWNSAARVQDLAQQRPRCKSYDELVVYDKWVCIDDSLYEIAPTMPLTTNLWESQNYATQIKLVLEWWVGDIITFWWRLWEMYIAPLFTTWPDWEYQLAPNVDC